ncbi:histone-lysine N-methyltransferase 2C-like [Stegastes partitus]|uniref:Histone-lysine N-methyltransferase 2C-like n=1 Tax=Stegastes partitus TaxID=144197 RepID=A0A9Y4KNT2_9TELE|nr:PREDICTED: histone-lysine N-methyltransferase 2C-like [Stegastes partitus]
MCCCCGNCYHGGCLDPPLAPSPLCRPGWQCPQCRVCQSCRLRGDEGVLLVCERCDKSYHTHCLTPPLDPTPSTGWSCKNCRVCRRCGVRSSGLWANHPFLCESCDPALPCPLCGHAPDLYTPQEYLTCICCYRYTHLSSKKVLHPLPQNSNKVLYHCTQNSNKILHHLSQRFNNRFQQQLIPVKRSSKKDLTNLTLIPQSSWDVPHHLTLILRNTRKATPHLTIVQESFNQALHSLILVLQNLKQVQGPPLLVLLSCTKALPM